MTLNLKAFGLALVAALAIGAIGAQAASAAVNHSFNSDVESTVLTGHNEDSGSSSSPHVFSAGATEVKCTTATFEGTNVGKERDTVTVHPKYSSCKFSGNNAATVDTGGCNYVFDSDTTEDAVHSPSEEHASVTLECESAHSENPHRIEITTGLCNLSFETTHASSVVVNHELQGATYTNLDKESGADESHSGKSSITVDATVNTIKFTATAGSFCGLGGLPAGTHSNGEYTGTATVTGYEDGTATGSTTNGFTWHHGNQVNIWVSGTP